jgi:hypothetical protein
LSIEPQRIRSCDELADALRARQDQLQLSNEFLEQCCGLTRGHIDKLLGPARTKNLSQFTLDCLLSALAIQLIPEPDVEQETRMRERRWEIRDECQVRRIGRVSDVVMERCRPHLFAALGRSGGTKRAASLTAKQRSRIARVAAQTRWRLHRAAVKVLSIASSNNQGTTEREVDLGDALGEPPSRTCSTSAGRPRGACPRGVGVGEKLAARQALLIRSHATVKNYPEKEVPDRIPQREKPLQDIRHFLDGKNPVWKELFSDRLSILQRVVHSDHGFVVQQRVPAPIIPH